MGQKFLDHDNILKEKKNLEQNLNSFMSVNKSLQRKIDVLTQENEFYKNQMNEKNELKIENQNLINEIYVKDEKFKEMEHFKDILEIDFKDLKEKYQESVKEVVHLHSTMMDLEHLNRINLENNKMLFTSQRIEFSRLNIGKFINHQINVMIIYFKKSQTMKFL